VRVVSTDRHFKNPASFKRIFKKDAEIIKLILAKAGTTLDPNRDEDKQLEDHASRHKIADIAVPAGRQVLRIRASQKLTSVDGDPRRYCFTMYAPQLSLAPVSTVRLGATVMFPLDFTARIHTAVVEPMPGQPSANLIGGGETPVQVGLQQAYGWASQADPKITISYTYQ
jgi:hypothetical protein